MLAISCCGSAMILPGLAIAVTNLCKMLSRIYAKPFWIAVHNLCIDPTASGVCLSVPGNFPLANGTSKVRQREFTNRLLRCDEFVECVGVS